MMCPYCGEEMLKGRAVNSTIHAVDLFFKKNGEKFKIKDLVPHESKIYTRITAGSSLDAFFCKNCEKFVMIAKCTNDDTV